VIGHISRNEDYSFVSGADGIDYFLHFRDTQAKSVRRVGTRISFDVTTSKDARPRAVNATHRSSTCRVVVHSSVNLNVKEETVDHV
jgi:cold shock CspA family protein